MIKNLQNISKNIGKYQIKKQINFGISSKIYLVNDKNKKPFSIKMYNNQSFDKHFENEVNILNTINGKHFPTIVETLQHKGNNCIVFPYYNQKDLFDTLVPQLPISNSKIMEYIGKMAEPIKDLHQYNIAHLDIKMENFLINYKTDDFILIDYGSSYKLDTFIPSLMMRGTKQYMSPELLYNKPVLKSDIWSLGCVALILYLRERLVFNNYLIDTQCYLNRINDSDYLLKEFLNDTLVVDHKKRMSIDELYQKYFI